MKKLFLCGICLVPSVLHSATFTDNFNRSATVANSDAAVSAGKGYILTQRAGDKTAMVRIVNQRVQFQQSGAGAANAVDIILYPSGIPLQNNAAGESFTVQADIRTLNSSSGQLLYGLAYNVQPNGSFYAARINTGSNGTVLQFIRVSAGRSPMAIKNVSNSVPLAVGSIYHLTLTSTKPGECSYALTGPNLDGGKLTGTVNESIMKLSGGYAGIYTSTASGIPEFDNLSIQTLPDRPSGAAFAVTSASTAVPEGRVSDHVFTGSQIMPGTSHVYVLYVPQQYVPGTPAAVYVSQDGARGFEAGVFDRLIHERKMPVCISVFVRPGQIAATLTGGSGRSMRCPQYDALGAAYADFVIEELLPAIAAENNIQFSDNPDLHAVGGNSSGGICAFNVAWERNDFFRRVYMASPSLVAFRGGDILPILVRKYEPKPIRAYMTVGTKDMNNSSGDWYIQAQSMNDAFKYAGYDYEYKIFEGAGHGAGFQSVEVFERVQKFLWNNWQMPVSVTFFPPRIADVFSVANGWEQTSENLPAPMAVPFVAAGQRILTAGNQPATTETFGNVSGLALSSDRWRLYIADETSRFISVMSLNTDGTLKNRYYAGWLHLPDKTAPANIGAYGVCVDKMDRLYVATALGVQLIDPAGHNQAIIPLPDGGAVTGLSFGGASNMFLYAQSSAGTVFKRRINVAGLSAGDPVSPPGQIGL